MKKVFAVYLVSAVFCIAGAYPMLLSAQSSDTSATDIQKQIDENNAQIDQLNREIQSYQTQLNATTEQKNTLINAINQLTLQNKQLTSKISVTKKQINTTQLQIHQLAGTISDTQESINTEHAGLAESLRRQAEVESQPLSVLLLSAGGISAAWQDLQDLDALQGAVNAHVDALAQKKQTLTDTKTAAEKKSTQLSQQQRTLQTQQTSLAVATKAQNDLLTQTRSQEATYQSIIAQKKAQEASFEATLNQLQAKLQNANTATVPVAGTSVLHWPLDSVFITQYFGNTAFAMTAAYKGQGHNGIDLRAAIGTPVHAALDGVVWQTNLGIAPNCQYGKWVLIKHPDGLSTLYAHLSSITVSAGQTVSTGDLIGYSGSTGYATGPHLHLTVFNTSGVSFATYKCNSGPSVKIPISPFNGYLNPLSYLPAQ
jgi:murein DD-endopeptidase MepM/ murein hydrolase activator NlpD